MATEKTPLLPAHYAVSDADKSRRVVAGYKLSLTSLPCVKTVFPVCLMLLLLTVVLMLPFLLDLGNVLALIGALSFHAHKDAPDIDYNELKRILLRTPSNDSAADWLRYYTAGPHLAGQNYSQAAWTRDRWADWGAEAHITAYDLYLNAPVDHCVSLLKAKKGEKGEKGGSDSAAWEVHFRASLEEDVLEDDPSTGLADRVPTFHAYSASGNVTGPVVYVNYGTFQDYADLERANISLQGAIVLARYGGIFRGLKVKRAQELGAIGVLLYSDPGDDGEATEANGYKPYPEGPARQPSSVQRGSVQFLSSGPGDPTTPGYPSKPGVPRTSPERTIPSIPSLPLSYIDALPILKALNGHGPTSKDFGHWWTRNEGLGGKGVDYNIGPTPADKVQVNLYNKQSYTTRPIWNVLGVFNGSVLPNEVIVVGNHRDAFIAGGAGDPNSGSAVVNEVVRSFGVAVARGWKPLRTIVFASWDGEEYGLLGSTEWVEEYLPWLDRATLAYLNIDMGVSGPNFAASGVPLIHDVVRAVTLEVPSPNQTVVDQTVGDVWVGHIGPLGSGSDYTAFLDHGGIPSVDVRFGGGGATADGEVEPVYHYHSNYDSFHWMEKYGDPGFVYHQTMAQVLALLTARLATDLVVPFQALDYANALHDYVDQIRKRLADSGVVAGHSDDDRVAVVRGRASAASVAASSHDETARERRLVDLALLHLDEAVSQLMEKAAKLDAKADALRNKVNDAASDDTNSTAAAFSVFAPNWWRRFVHRVRRLWLAFQISAVNGRYQFLERKFLYNKGLDNREWFKHVVYAPGIWTGYTGAVFPGLVESIEAGNWTNAVRWSGIIEDCVLAAAKGL